MDKGVTLAFDNIQNCENLVERIAEGDSDALSELYKKYKKAVYLIALAILNDHSLAEDAVQETFLRIRNKAFTFRAGTKYKAWILTVARSVALNMRSKHRKETDFSDIGCVHESLEHDVAEKAIFDVDFTRAIECLGEQEKTIVILRIGENLKHAEIAKILGISKGSCRMKYSRAIKKVKHYFAGWKEGD